MLPGSILAQLITAILICMESIKSYSAMLALSTSKVINVTSIT